MGRVADVAFEAMHSEVHAGEAAGFVGLLDAVDGRLATRIAGVLGRETLIPVPAPTGRRVAGRPG